MSEQADYIKVWRFNSAPEELQKLSGNGGDEDWLALIPASMKDDWFGWMESGSPFGCCCVDSYDLPDGSEVRIGSHA